MSYFHQSKFCKISVKTRDWWAKQYTRTKQGQSSREIYIYTHTWYINRKTTANGRKKSWSYFSSGSIYSAACAGMLRNKH